MTLAGRFLRLPRSQRLLVVEAILVLPVARLATRLLSFHRIAAWLGTMQPPAAAPAFQLTPAQMQAVREVRWATAAVGDRLPITTACLPRALAARALCRRRHLPSTLHLGAEAGQQDGGETHAWLDCGGMPITGFPLPKGMVEVGCFPEDGGTDYA